MWLKVTLAEGIIPKWTDFTQMVSSCILVGEFSDHHTWIEWKRDAVMCEWDELGVDLPGQ